jgi:hypothetical protein
MEEKEKPHFDGEHGYPPNVEPSEREVALKRRLQYEAVKLQLD